MQRKLIAPIAVLGLAGAGLATVAALLASGQDSPAPAAPRDSGAVIQVTDTPATTTSVAVTTTSKTPATTSSKVEVRTTEQQAAAPRKTVQQRQVAAADDPVTTTDPGTSSSDDTAAVPPTHYQPTPCSETETSPDCLDDGLHNGSS